MSPEKEIMDPAAFGKIQELFGNATGLAVTTFDSFSVQLCPSSHLNPLCSRLLGLRNEKPEVARKCLDTHYEGLKEALKTGKIHKYECYLGLESAAIPLKVNDKIVGGVTVGRTKMKKLDPKAFEVFEKFGLNKDELLKLAEQVEEVSPERYEHWIHLLSAMATSIVHERFQELEEKRRDRSLSFISELSRHVGEALDQLLDYIVHALPDACGLEKCTLFLLDEKKGELVAKASNAFSSEDLAGFKVSVRNEKGQVVVDPEPFFSPDAAHDPRLIKEYVEKCRIKSLLTIPLRVREKILGVIHFVNSEDYHHFGVEEVGFINALAAEVSLAIESTWLEERRVEQKKANEMSVVYEAANIISTPIDLDQILAATAEQMCALAKVNRCFIFLLDKERKVLSTVLVQGATSEQKDFFSALAVPLNFLEGPLWEKFKQGRPLALTHEQIEKEDLPMKNLFSLFGTNTCLLAPILSEQRMTGFVYLDNGEIGHEFSDSQIRSIAALSIHAATAIERAQLYKQSEDQAQQVHTLYQISTALSTSLNLERILNIIVEKSTQLVQADRFCLFMWDDDLNAFVAAASHGLSSEFVKKAFVKIEDRFVGLASTKKKPVYSANVLLETDNPQLIRLFKKEGLGAVLAVPLVTKRKTIGVITYFADLGYQFKEKEVHLLGNFASHAALSIENARLYHLNKRKVQELGILFDVGKRINEHLNPQEVLRSIAEQFISVMNSDGCSIMLLDKGEKTLSIEATRGTARRTEVHKKIKIGEGFVGKVARTGHPVVIHDDGETPAFPAGLRQEGITTILSVPLSAKEEILGVLNLYTKQSRNYTASEMHLMQTLASQGAIALRNARTFQENYHVAQLIHRSLLPSDVPEYRDLEFGFQYLPSQEISGDYYDFLELRGKLGITIADVSGKGTGAAIFTAQAKYAWKAYGLLESNPQKVLANLNRMMVDNTPVDKFISMFYGVLDIKKKEFVYSNAGHLPPLLYRSGANKCRLLNAPGLLLGIDSKVEYGKRSVTLHSGDILLFYTDGVTEARNESREIFGIERLEKVFIENANLSAQVIAGRILASVRHFAQRRNLEDDITIVVVKVK